MNKILICWVFTQISEFVTLSNSPELQRFCLEVTTDSLPLSCVLSTNIMNGIGYKAAQHYIVYNWQLWIAGREV